MTEICLLFTALGLDCLRKCQVALGEKVAHWWSKPTNQYLNATAIVLQHNTLDNPPLQDPAIAPLLNLRHSTIELKHKNGR